MGYAATTIAIYGVEIENTPENGPLLEKLSSMITEEGLQLKPFDIWLSDDFSITQEVYDQYLPSRGRETLGAELYDKIESFDPNPNRFQIYLAGDGADSRIEPTDEYYEEGHMFYFGIFLASKGYAYSDKLNDFIKNINKLALDRWEEYCKPMLTQVGLPVTEPEVHIITQTW